MVTRIAIMLGVMLASVAWGQTLHQTDQNVFDLNPERDALTGLSGSQRIRADFYGDPGFTDSYDLSPALPLTLTITTTQDAWTVTSTSVSNVPPNRVYWSFSVGVGVYRLQSTANLPGDNVPVFDRYLVVTSTPPAADTTVNVSATVTSVLQGAATISLVPLQSNVGVIGTSDLPWGEFHAGTGTFSRLTVSETLEVSDAIQAADTGAVKLVGSIMTGPLTNEAGFFGDGAGLTNLTVAGDGNETNATGIGVVLTPTNYTLSTPDVEAALIGIDQAFAASGSGVGLGDTNLWQGPNTWINESVFSNVVRQSYPDGYNSPAVIIESGGANALLGTNAVFQEFYLPGQSIPQGGIFGNKGQVGSPNTIGIGTHVPSDSGGAVRYYEMRGKDEKGINLELGTYATYPFLNLAIIDSTTATTSTTANAKRILYLFPASTPYIWWNVDGIDLDFRVDGDLVTHLLFVDSGLSRVGIKDSTPSYELDVNGTINAATAYRINATLGLTANVDPSTITNLIIQGGIITGVQP